jgi:hypothetical protein
MVLNLKVALHDFEFHARMRVPNWTIEAKAIPRHNARRLGDPIGVCSGIRCFIISAPVVLSSIFYTYW